MFLDPHRVGGCCIPANQSLRGVILRIDPSFGSGPVLAVAMIVAIVGVALAVLASRRGDEATGFSLCAVTGLLVSPVSWSHHWTLAVPALALMGLRAVQAHSAIALTAVGAVALVGYSYLPKLMGKPAVVPRHGLPVVRTVAAAPYVWLGLGALALACVAEARRHVPALHHVEVSSPRLRPGMRVEVPSP
jgi:hypothetical protein